MKSRQEIKALAKEAVAAQRKTAILLDVVFFLVVVAFLVVAVGVALIFELVLGITHSATVVIWVLYIPFILVMSVVYINAYGEHIKIYRQEKASVSAMFTGLKVNFWRKLGGFLWMDLWILLWSLLLIVPGIIKSLAYSMTLFILADHPKVEARQALKISMKMTDGHKGKIFVFGLSFIGWILLPLLPAIIISFAAILAAGGLFGVWLALYVITLLGAIVFYVVVVYPYLYAAYAGLYVELQDKALAEGKVTHEELGHA